MKILLVEDDEGLARVVEEALAAQHYLVDTASDGQMGWELAEAFEYDLILLDLLLPKLDGITFCKQRRLAGDRTPILLMTARDDSEYKVKGLDAGADDYLVKPFNLEELLARVRALLRRGNDALPPAIEWGLLRLDPSSCQVTYDGKVLKLTAKEYGLLELFLRNQERIFSQSALLDHLWSFEEPPSETAVRTQIKGLRQKLKSAGATGDLIETVYGLGYRLNPKLAERAREVGKAHNPFNPSQLNSIWERHRSSYLDRVSVLQEALLALRDGNFNSQLQQQALREAHTLAGSLGSFGFEVASETSREIERLLKSEAISSEQLDCLSELIVRLQQALAPDSNGDREATPPPELARASLQNDRTVPTAGTRLLVVDDDLVLARGLASEAIAQGIQTDLAASPSQARSCIERRRPDAVLLDLSFPHSSEAGFELLSELSTVQPPIPVVVFTAKESFADRVKVARLGGRAFLHKPIAPYRAIDAIARVLQYSHPPTAKLLIVDDDPHLLDLLHNLLNPWGFQLVLLDDPRQFWETLEQSQPDLLILDIKMPHISGIDLCQVVRNDPKWQNLPILMLSAHRTSAIVQQVFVAGADDYIQKPIVEPELIARVLNRLEREGLRRNAIARKISPSPETANEGR